MADMLEEDRKKALMGKLAAKLKMLVHRGKHDSSSLTGFIKDHIEKNSSSSKNASSSLI